MSKKSPESVVVHPVPGFFLLGVSSSTQELPAKQAAEYVASGAFTYDPPPDAPAEPTPSGPADAGPSDSTEV